MANDKSDNLQVIRGLPFPYAKEFKKKNIEDAMDYKPKDGDVIVASYPKSGTTWLEYIVLQIVSRGTKFPTFDELTWKVVPFLEMTGIAVVEDQPQPRIYKHHLPYDMFQKNENAKCLYIYRNPEDIMVSYHRFMQSYNEDVPIDFDEFFEDFVGGNIGFGCCLEHVLSFHSHRDDSNLLMVSYEQLHAKTREEILRIAKFLGEGHFQSLVEDEALLNKIMENTSFQHMKKNLFLTHPDYQHEVGSVDNDGKKVLTFFRKGIVGDGKNVLTETQRARIREMVEKTMKDTTIAQEWLKN